jgi:arabinose-5-phosphate isomerase
MPGREGKKVMTAHIEAALRTLEVESQCVAKAAASLGLDFERLCDAILEARGKVITTGLGKSGFIARKLASTLASTGTPAFYLHPSEAMHGDFGIIQKDDVLVAIAYGGETAEVNEVAKYCRRLKIPVAAITGKLDSTLASMADFAIDGSVSREACPLNLAPTSSALVAMALGDALGVALMEARGFTANDFANLHPAGSLGRRLSRVRDHMHPRENIPVVTPGDDFHHVLEAVTKGNFGIAAVISVDGHLLGSVSDGDVRRHLLKSGARALAAKVSDFMKSAPRVVKPDMLAIDAVTMMESNQITSLFVVEPGLESRLAGLVRMHDLLAAKIV